MCTCQANAGTVFVNVNAIGANNGSSWNDAFVHFQDALTAATAADDIWIAKGVYYPDRGLGLTNNDTSLFFKLKTDVAIYGGFLDNEGQLTDRRPHINSVILSGDIDHNDETNNGVVMSVANIKGNNSRRILHCDDAECENSTLDGVTITAGNGFVSPSQHGGAIQIKMAHLH
jgi:hypothetical protein